MLAHHGRHTGDGELEIEGCTGHATWRSVLKSGLCDNPAVRLYPVGLKPPCRAVQWNARAMAPPTLAPKQPHRNALTGTDRRIEGQMAATALPTQAPASPPHSRRLRSINSVQCSWAVSSCAWKLSSLFWARRRRNPGDGREVADEDAILTMGPPSSAFLISRGPFPGRSAPGSRTSPEEPVPGDSGSSA